MIIVAVFFLAAFSGVNAAPEASLKADTIEHEASEGVRWNRWSNAIFEKAKRENRLVLVDFAADWCHFCKKMDQTTWRDSEVIAAIEEGYIPVRVEDEIDVELAEKYRKYGRPAIVVLDGEGAEVYKKRGYLEPRSMLWTLQGVAQDFKP
jgi:thiol:disulfide interchange protein